MTKLNPMQSKYSQNWFVFYFIGVCIFFLFLFKFALSLNWIFLSAIFRCIFFLWNIYLILILLDLCIFCMPWINITLLSYLTLLRNDIKYLTYFHSKYQQHFVTPTSSASDESDVYTTPPESPIEKVSNLHQVMPT